MRLLFNLLLAIVWCALTGSMTTWNFLAGMAVGSVVIGLYANATGDDAYFGSGWKLFKFLVYFTKIMVRANLQVAWEVLTPQMHQTPRIIRYSVKGMTDVERTILASAITLTPGTLVVDISPDDEWLYVHCMYAKDRQSSIDEIDELARELREKVFA